MIIRGRNLIIIIVSIFLFALMYFVDLPELQDTASTFLTISTFIFAILAGFFIYRQDSRYTSIRDTIAEFDGNMSSLYRRFEGFGKKVQKQAGEIIKKHYKKILDSGQWDYQFTHKSSTITDLNRLLSDAAGTKNYPSLMNEGIGSMLGTLDNLQLARKNMVALQVERIPRGEWILTFVLAALTLYSLILVPVDGSVVSLILKAVFGALVVQVVLLLYELDSLQLFERTLGESSARDILNIIAGKR